MPPPLIIDAALIAKRADSGRYARCSWLFWHTLLDIYSLIGALLVIAGATWTL